MKKRILLLSTALCLLIGNVFVLRSVLGGQTKELNLMVEALSQTETVFCIYDPDWECTVMHPDNPDLDETRPYSRWWR